MPGWAFAVVVVVEFDGLGVAEMAVVVPAAVTEVDAADERDVVGGVGSTHHEQLLVVAPAAAHPVIEEHFATRVVDHLGKREVLRLTEVHQLGVRAPEEPADIDPLLHQLDEHGANLRARSVKQFVGIALPVGEVDPIAGLALAQHLVQSSEVSAAIDQDRAVVALGPRELVVVAPVDVGRRIPPLGGQEEPVFESHRPRR